MTRDEMTNHPLCVHYRSIFAEAFGGLGQLTMRADKDAVLVQAKLNLGTVMLKWSPKHKALLLLVAVEHAIFGTTEVKSMDRIAIREDDLNTLGAWLAVQKRDYARDA